MNDFRPVGHVIGWLTVVLGLLMLVPAALDLADGDPNWQGVALAAFLTLAGGLALTLVTRTLPGRGMTRRQAFLLTVLTWGVLPVFGALPFVFGAPFVGYTDAYFEAISGMTTTGATVITGLEDSPRGMLLWRAMTQWLGGVGIVVFAIVFLPMMKVGGMQFFRSEAFDLSGDIVPRATAASIELGIYYLVITIGCMLLYSVAGMTAFDAISHAMTTVSTGGMANYDAGFGIFSPLAQYVSVLFMWLGAIPFLRMIQFARGRFQAPWEDTQIRAFLGIVLAVSGVVAAYLIYNGEQDLELAVRLALFNVTSNMTGTGYATADYNAWGGLPLSLLFIVMLVGGCTGSTSCSAKVFRYQVLFKAMVAQIRRIHMPHGVYPLRYNGRPVEAEVVSSIMSFFFVFASAISLWAIMLSLLGLDVVTAISGAVATLCNVGPGFGPVIGPAGNYAPLPDTAKWLMSAGMLLGRLEFLSVLVLLTPMFWSR